MKWANFVLTGFYSCLHVYSVLAFVFRYNFFLKALRTQENYILCVNKRKHGGNLDVLIQHGDISVDSVIFL